MLATLEDMATLPRVGECELNLVSLDAVRASRRNAGGEPFYQWRLKQYVDSLVKAYGYRDDYRGASPPFRVPFVPQPFAAEMVSYFVVQARYFLGKSIPVGAKQPNFIKRWMGEAEDVVGIVRRGEVTVPNERSYEAAPAQVAAKAPDMFKVEVPAGRPHSRVLTAPATWRLLNALLRLAIHFDGLSGTPTKIDIFSGAVEESADELLEKAVKWADDAGQWTLETLGKVPDAARAVIRAPGQALKAGKDILTLAAVVGVGVLALWAVSR